MFLPEERRGRNCTGRVPGKDQHKGQLDPVKLQAVKNITFRKYTYKLKTNVSKFRAMYENQIKKINE